MASNDYYIPLTPGGWVTDDVPGLVLGVINGTTEPGFAWISGTVGSVTAIASGGTLLFTEGGIAAFGNSFLLPIPPYSEFTLAVNPIPNQPATPAAQFYWIPTSAISVATAGKAPKQKK